MMAISDQEIAAIVGWLDGKPKEGSAEDLAGRRALAKVLRYGPLDRGLLFMLADLIDPDSRDDIGQWLVFKRARGRSKTVNSRQVAAVVWHQVKARCKREAAYEHAKETLGVSFSAAEKAFAQWADVFNKSATTLKGITRNTE
jgi:hypothetical protein